MKLQTNIPLNPESVQIDYNSKLLLIGSCFTEHIGDKFDFYKFRQLVNPFGIIFHPKAIEKLILRACDGNDFTSEDVFQKDGTWHCLEVHSLISGSEETEYLIQLNKLLKNLKDTVSAATHIFITYGTAWGYRHKQQEMIVANCHKLPQKEFSKELSSVVDLIEINRSIVNAIKSLNDQTEIVFTVSPVRHLKDGFVENSRSKAHLVSAIHACMDLDDELRYFPSYEIMMDELRDYRFYSEDMLHPSKTAIAIIWERFSDVWIDPKTIELQKQIAAIQNGLQHRPFNHESPEHKLFLEELQKKITAVKQLLPHLNF